MISIWNWIHILAEAMPWEYASRLGQGPAGRTIRNGETMVVHDLENEENFQLGLEDARARGFRGVISLPLKDATRTFGALVLYLSEVRHPQPDELQLLQELADNMAFGIVNIRDRRARQRMQTALVNVATAVSATTGLKFFEQLADNMAKALGAHAIFVAQCEPGEPLRARTIAASIYAARKQEIAVVLTDMMMPLMDGPTTIQVLLRINPRVRIIAASGLNANAMFAKTTSAGVKRFLPKPYTAQTLLMTLREVLDA